MSNHSWELTRMRNKYVLVALLTLLFVSVQILLNEIREMFCKIIIIIKH